jgi:hypothetical protein
MGKHVLPVARLHQSKKQPSQPEDRTGHCILERKTWGCLGRSVLRCASLKSNPMRAEPRAKLADPAWAQTELAGRRAVDSPIDSACAIRRFRCDRLRNQTATFRRAAADSSGPARSACVETGCRLLKSANQDPKFYLAQDQRDAKVDKVRSSDHNFD